MSPLTTIVSIFLTALFGSAGSGGLMYWYLKKRKQEHNQQIEVSEKFEERLDKVEDEHQNLKRKYESLRDRENKLVYQVNVLIKRIEMLIKKLEDYDELSDEEKQHLTNLPKFRSVGPEETDNGSL